MELVQMFEQNKAILEKGSSAITSSRHANNEGRRRKGGSFSYCDVCSRRSNHRIKGFRHQNLDRQTTHR
jgi:hypothetical protein